MVIANAAHGRHPSLAFPLDDGGRGYTFGDPPEYFYSVTTIIGGGVPKHLQRWAAKLVAELVVESMDRPYSRATAILRRWERAGRAWVDELRAAGELRSIDPAKLEPVDFTLRWLKGQPDRVRDAAASRGSAVHALAEDLVLAHVRESGAVLLEGGDLAPWPEALDPWMQSFLGFVRDRHPVYHAAEATVFNRPEAYAGTLDAILELPGLTEGPEVLDYKTGGDIYPEVAQQLASYARGEFVGHPDGHTRLAMPAVSLERGWVLHLQPARRRADGTWIPRYRLIPVAIGQPAWDAFRHARENYRWVTVTSREVLGKALGALAEEEVA